MTHDSKAIVHIVTWRLNGQGAGEKYEQGQKIVSAFNEMRSKVSGLLRLDAGLNIIADPDAWDVAVSMVFADRTALQSYLDHPCHLNIKKLVGPMRAARAQVDFELAA